MGWGGGIFFLTVLNEFPLNSQVVPSSFNVFPKMFPMASHYCLICFLPKVKILEIYIYKTIKGGPKGINTHVLLFWGVPNVSKKICDGPITVQNFGCNPQLPS